MASTIFVALLLIISCSFSLVQSDDQQCKNDLQGFLKCLKEEHDKVPEADRQARKEEMKTKTSKCFTDNGCDAPKFDDNDATAKAMKEHMSEMPKEVKQCIKQKVIEKFGPKLNECLGRHQPPVPPVDFKALTDHMDESSGAGMGMDMEGGKDGIQGALQAKFTTVKSVDACCKDKKDGKPAAMKPLEECLHGMKKDKKPQMCAMIKPCEDKISADCKKRGRDILDALCQCKQEKEAEIAKKLQDMGASQEKVKLQDLMHAVAPDIDMQWIANQIEGCYNETKSEPSAKMQLAMKMMGSDGPLAKIQLQGRTVVIMGDMLALDAEDKTECQPCP